MRAALVVGGWLAVGVIVGLRGRRPAWERVLVVAFWPLFLFASAGQGPVDPVVRLRAALAEADPAAPLVDELAAAIARLHGRVARLDAALVAVQAEVDGDPALREARLRSRALLLAARGCERAALDDARAAIEEAATQLWLLREAGESGEVDALLAGLAARLRASEEVARSAEGAAAGGVLSR